MPPTLIPIPAAIFLRWALVYPSLVELLGAMAGQANKEAVEAVAGKSAKVKTSKQTISKFIAATLDQLAELRQGGVGAIEEAKEYSAAELADLESSLINCLQCRSDHLGRKIVADESFVAAAKKFLEEQVMPEVDKSIGVSEKAESPAVEQSEPLSEKPEPAASAMV